MNWEGVGDWVKKNAGTGAALIGSLLTGNVPGAVAAGVSLVSGATGTNDPAEALAVLQSDPSALIRLKELANDEQANIRAHIEGMERLRLEDAQREHEQTQTTIRTGDTAADEYVRRTRPQTARQSWYGTLTYVLVLEIGHATGLLTVGASWEIATLLISPAGAYMGFRTWDKARGRG
jgi:hypothetical protein